MASTRSSKSFARSHTPTQQLQLHLADGRSLMLPQTRDGFRHLPGPDNTLLVVPQADKWRWQESELPFRSLIINHDGTLHSVGWPKFGNLGEGGFQAHDRRLHEDLQHGAAVWLSEKLDGSLIIRSVAHGQVSWRTRGSHHLGVFADGVIPLVSRQFPSLDDPLVASEQSLLFEFTARDPRYRVVIPYQDEQLRLIGGIEQATLRLLPQTEVEQLARTFQLDLVEAVVLPDNLRAIEQTVKQWSGREGIVARTADGQTLVKIKSAHYLGLHRLRSQLSVTALRQMIVTDKITSLDQFQQQLQASGADWEIFVDAEPVIRAASSARAQAADRLDQLDTAVDYICLQHPGKRAEQLAAIGALDQREQDAARLLLDGQMHQAAEVLERRYLDAALAPFINQEAALNDDLAAAPPAILDERR